MAKRSRKQSARSKKDNAGCMSGLISIFDFRQGHSTRKLLLDRRRGSGRHLVGTRSLSSKLNSLANYEENHDDFENVDESQVERVELGTTSVKALIEEEMVREQYPEKIPNAEFEQIRNNFGCSARVEKIHRQANETCEVACDLVVNDIKASKGLESDHSACPNTVEKVSHNLDLAALVERFFYDSHQCQEMLLDCKSRIDSCPSHKSIGTKMHDDLDPLDTQLVQNHSFLQNALSEVVDGFLNHNMIDSKQLTSDGALQSEEFINFLQLLNSNKEVFLNLLQDPNSLLVKLKNAQEEKLSKLGVILEGGEMLGEGISSSRKCDEPVSYKQIPKQNIRSFFRKKDRPQETKPSKTSDSSHTINRIVVLKPTPTRIPNPSNTTSPSSSPHCHHSSRDMGINERVYSHFSLREIRRRLKSVIGEGRKEQRLTSIDGFPQRKSTRSQDSGDIGKMITRDGVEIDLASKTSCDGGQASQLPCDSKKRDKKIQPKESRTSVEREVASPRVSNASSASSLLLRESYFQREAKKHIAEMLNKGNEDRGSSTRLGSKTSGRILSVPEDMSPKLSPGRDKEPILSPRQLRLSPSRQFKQENDVNCLSPVRQNMEGSTCSGSNPSIELQEFDLSPALPDIELTESIAIGGASSPKGMPSHTLYELPATIMLDSHPLNSDTEIHENYSGCEETVETVNTKYIEEGKETVEMVNLEYDEESKEIVETVDTEYNEESRSLGIISESTVDGPTDVAERCEDQGSCASSSLSSVVEITPPMVPLVSTPPDSLFVNNMEDPEKLMEKPERPSPISVLEPLFLEDITSPGSTTAEDAEIPIEPRQLQFEEHHCSGVVQTSSDTQPILRTCVEENEAMFMYVRDVLEASGLVYNEMSVKWHSRDQLLDPSLYDEVETSSGEIPDDLKLYFDCLSEVLEEIRQRFFSCSPWVAFVKPNTRPFPSGESLIQEVWKAMSWHLSLPFPCTLDHIVGKDMETRTWMDLPFETEYISIEMADLILKDILEERIFEVCG